MDFERHTMIGRGLDESGSAKRHMTVCCNHENGRDVKLPMEEAVEAFSVCGNMIGVGWYLVTFMAFRKMRGIS